MADSNGSVWLIVGILGVVGIVGIIGLLGFLSCVRASSSVIAPSYVQVPSSLGGRANG